MLRQCPITIEVIAHYPISEDNNFGTFHIQWKEAGIEFRGCEYCFNMKSTWVSMPSKSVLDKETNKKVRYPVFIIFEDALKQKELADKLREAFLKYAQEKNLAWSKPKPKPKSTFKPRDPNFRPSFQPRSGKFKPNQFVDLSKHKDASNSASNGPKSSSGDYAYQNRPRY